ncbi:serine protease [Dactylosporangium salmoneum]|uniref:Nephrocystin 3-like N-terminal domain-containing protein n=1 Tax=Dactylosporangium salmoneum TaxID=53361 RepID=A0ABN3G6D0_9ACTN
MSSDWSAARVAEVLAGARRGSGYRVGNGLVLTAAHVVAGAGGVTVRFDAGRPGEWSAPARLAWSDPGADLAVLAFDPPPAAPPAGPSPIGRLGERRAVLEVYCAGFPRWKLRTEGNRVYRDLAYVTGALAVPANRRSGTLEVRVDPPAEDPDPAASPWEAMSGAALWAGERLIGVVAAHHRREGAGRLTAVPLRLDDARLAELLGVAGPAPVPDVTAPAAARLARSGYREQVRDLAPAGGTLDRGAELDELARCCAGPDPYAWWRAGPWAGKTALMSAFVLDPPTGVDVVAFFVTARLATQSDSTAFTDAVLDQLAALTGEQIPASLTPAARDAHRRALLQAAAERAGEQGRRLVLVVDGLDEDTGARPGSGLASIAALLPRHPHPALRVIVAGRPDPPIPADVPLDHPLRTCPVRTLPVSPHATRIAELAGRELAELLAADGPQQDVIGLVTAAGGGLSRPELEALTGLPGFRLDALLHGVAGRTVAGRDDHETRRVYLFAHETLHAEARAGLGATVETYRRRIHEWAEHYRVRGWPADTPEYLLRGYSPMLRERPDPARLAALAADPARHERLRALTGGDAAALTEVQAALDAAALSPDLASPAAPDAPRAGLAEARPPDLALVARLAAHRADLAGRSANLPPELPALWARLGRPARAEALALAVTDPSSRAWTLKSLAETYIDTGQYDRAERLTAELTTPDAALTLAGLAHALGTAGERPRAAALIERAHALLDEWSHLGTPGKLARAAVAAGLPERALELAAGIDGGFSRDDAYAELTAALAEAGDWDRAERAARAIDEPAGQAKAVAAMLARATGDPARVPALAGWAETIPAAGDARMDLVAALAAAGEPDRAAALAESTADPGHRALALAALATAATTAGDEARAAHLAHLVESTGTWAALCTLARSIAPADPARARALLDRAAGLADSPAQEDELPAWSLTMVANAAADLGEPTLAATLLDRAGAFAERIDEPGARAEVRTAMAGVALAHAARPDATPDAAGRAEAMLEAALRAAVALPGAGADSTALTRLMDAAARAGDVERAERIAETIDPEVFRWPALRQLVEIVATRGDFVRARRLAVSAGPPRARAAALISTAWAALRAGAPARAAALADEAERVAVGAGQPRPDAWEMAALAVGHAEAGHLDRAERIAALLPAQTATQDIAEIAAMAVEAGDPDRAERIAAAVAEPHGQAQVLSATARALAAAGNRDRALRVTATIPDPDVRAETLLTLARDDNPNTSGGGQAGRALDLAEQAAHVVAAPRRRDDVLHELVLVAGDADRREPALRAAVAIADEFRRAEALVRLWQGAIAARDRPWAEQLFRAIDDAGPADLIEPLLARAAAAVDPDRSRALIDRAEPRADHALVPDAQAWSLTMLAAAARQAGEPDRAAALADWAELVIARIHQPQDQLAALVGLVEASSVTGDHERAERLATESAGLFELADLLGRYTDAGAEPGRPLTRHLPLLARVVAAAGDRERAGRLAAGIESGTTQADVLTELAAEATLAGDHEQAERLIRAVRDPRPRADGLARSAANADDPERATALAAEAERDALGVSDPRAQAEILVRLAADAPSRDAARLIARAFAAGHPSIALKALARRFPEAFLRYAGERLP